MSSFKNEFEEWIAERNGERFLRNCNDFYEYIDYDRIFGILRSTTYRDNGCSVTYCVCMRYGDDFLLIRLFGDKKKAEQLYNLLITY